MIEGLFSQQHKQHLLKSWISVQFCKLLSFDFWLFFLVILLQRAYLCLRCNTANNNNFTWNKYTFYWMYECICTYVRIHSNDSNKCNNKTLNKDRWVSQVTSFFCILCIPIYCQDKNPPFLFILHSILAHHRQLLRTDLMYTVLGFWC